MRYPSTTILGNRGAGKSVTARMIAQQYHDKDNLKIISNMTMYGLSNYERKKFSEIKELLPDLFDCVLIIDEGHKGSDAYNFFTKDVRKFTDWLDSLRKRRITLFLITQNFNKLAKRFREDCEYIMIPKKMKNDIYQVQVFDQSKGFGSDLIKTFFFNGNSFYRLYETNELIEE
jgi:ABC-type multidrug transport system ATPase subunit